MKRYIVTILIFLGVVFAVILFWINFSSPIRLAQTFPSRFMNYEYKPANDSLIRQVVYTPADHTPAEENVPVIVNDTVYFRNRVVIRDSSYVIDTNQVLVIEPGTEVLFEKGTGIVCYSSILAKGSPGREIYFLPLVPAQRWENITIMGNYDLRTKLPSYFSNCVFRGGGGIDTEMTGHSNFDRDSTNKISNFPLLHEQSTTRGGAIAGFMANITIDSSIFEDNMAAEGGAVFLRCGGLFIDHCLFKLNVSVYLDPLLHDGPGGTTIYCRGDRFARMIADRRPDIENSELRVNNSVFLANGINITEQALAKGENMKINGTIYLGKHHGITHVKDNVFDSNTVYPCGAVLYHHHDRGINICDKGWEINNNLITNNMGSSDPNGGGGSLISIADLKLEHGPLAISKNLFINNRFARRSESGRDAYIYIFRPDNITCEDNKIRDRIDWSSSYIALKTIDTRERRRNPETEGDIKPLILFSNNDAQLSFLPFAYPVYIYKAKEYTTSNLAPRVLFKTGAGKKLLPYCNYRIDQSLYAFVVNIFTQHYLLATPIMLIFILWWSGELFFVFIALNAFFGGKISRLMFIIFRKYLLSKRTILKIFDQYLKDIAENRMNPDNRTTTKNVIYDLYKGIPLEVPEGRMDEIQSDKAVQKAMALDQLKRYFSAENRLLYWATYIDDSFLDNILEFYVSNNRITPTYDKVSLSI